MMATRKERGAAAPFVAASLFMLMMAAAWAVDASALYGGLRSDQTVADLACLAGAAELPGTNSAAFQQAAAIVKVNMPVLSAGSLTVAGNQAALVNASGDRAVFDAHVNGDPNRFRVTMRTREETSFARVAGMSSVDLEQVATCSGGFFQDRPDTVPFGALVGGFTGGIFAPNPCGTGSGNCGSLFIEGESNNEFVSGSANGVDVVVTPNVTGSGTQDCRTAASGASCDIVSSNTGMSASVMGDAMLARLDEPVHECQAWVRSGNRYNCDTLSQVLGGAPPTLTSVFASRPSWWDTSLYGAYSAANTTNHYYWDNPIAHCDSPRLVSLPIVSTNLSWKLGDPATGWPSGKKDMKVVGMYDVVILEPNADDDFAGSGNLKQISGAVVWFGPGATCYEGRLPYGSLNGGDGLYERLIRLEPNS